MRKDWRWLVLILLTILLTVSGAAACSKKQMGKKVPSAVTALEYQTIETIINLSSQTVSSNTNYTWRKGLLERTETDEGTIILSDGQKKIELVYEPAKKTADRYRGSTTQLLDQLLEVLLRSPLPGLKEERKVEKVNGFLCEVRGGKEESGFVWKIWVARIRNYIVPMRLLMIIPEKMVVTQEVKSMKVGIKISDDLFRLPPGMKIIDRGESVSIASPVGELLKVLRSRTDGDAPLLLGNKDRAAPVQVDDVLKEWAYPNAKPYLSFGFFEGSALHAQLHTTPESLENVWNFYAKKVGDKSIPFDTFRGVTGGLAGEFFIGDDRRPDVHSATLFKRTERHTISIFISRGSKEDQTHITLVIEER